MSPLPHSSYLQLLFIMEPVTPEGSIFPENFSMVAAIFCRPRVGVGVHLAPHGQFWIILSFPQS